MPFFKTPVVSKAVDQLWPAPGTAESPAPVRALLVIPANEPNAEADQRMTTMMEQGCGLKPAEYRVIRLPAGDVAWWPTLQQQYQPACVILCGIAPEALGIQALLPSYALASFSGCTFIVAHSPAQLADNDLRKRLWLDALQPFFRG